MEIIECALNTPLFKNGNYLGFYTAKVIDYNWGVLLHTQLETSERSGGGSMFKKTHFHPSFIFSSPETFILWFSIFLMPLAIWEVLQSLLQQNTHSSQWTPPLWFTFQIMFFRQHLQTVSLGFCIGIFPLPKTIFTEMRKIQLNLMLQWDTKRCWTLRVALITMSVNTR